MEHGEKYLLLKDICARLPYGVKCRQRKLDSQVCTMRPEYLKNVEDVEKYEPYLRPMESMTEEEKEELKQEHLKDEKLYSECLAKAAQGDNSMRGKVIVHFAADWCNKNHFDYRGLIEKGLALEAPEGMYKTE